MWTTILVIAGILIGVLVMLDIIKTTLSMQGGGMMTDFISRNFWKTVLKLSGGNPKSPFLDHSGYILLVIIVVVWILSLWGSFFLLLLADPNSVINSTTHLPADTLEKLYYAGFNLSTAGIGDYVASNNLWRIVTDLYSASGLVFITMSITYFVPVLSAVITQRELGLGLGSLGDTPVDMMINGYNGKNFKLFIKGASKFSGVLFKHSQNHRAYPVIHYFHNTKEHNAVILQIAKLYDALLIFENTVKEELQPPAIKLAQIKRAIENYTEVAADVDNLKVGDEEQPIFYLQSLENRPYIRNLEIHLSSEACHRRLVLMKLVQKGGWDWNTIYGLN